VSNLQALLERVEKAEGPDRVLDAAIWSAVTGHETHYPNPYMREAEGLHAYTERRGDDLSRWYPVPGLTASIDAAVGLVERMLPGCWVDLCGPRKYLHIPTPSPNHWRGMVNAWNAQGDVVGWGATPALALIAALLRAMIAKEQR